MDPSEDKVIEEKKQGQKASWELPETAVNNEGSGEADNFMPTLRKHIAQLQRSGRLRGSAHLVSQENSLFLI